MLTKIQREELIEYLATHELRVGSGTKDSSCSMGAINLARYGEVSDSIPPDMSKITGSFIVRVQDMIPMAIRNSQQWKYLLPDAADTTSGGFEDRRMDLIVEWMWKILSYMQVTADKGGYGSQWAAMIKDKTDIAARAAELGAYKSFPVAGEVGSPDWIASDRMAAAARYAKGVVIYPYGDDDDDDDDDPCSGVADAIASAANAFACQHENRDQGLLEFWWKVNPPGMLKKLIEVTECPRNTP